VATYEEERRRRQRQKAGAYSTSYRTAIQNLPTPYNLGRRGTGRNAPIQGRTTQPLGRIPEIPKSLTRQSAVRNVPTRTRGYTRPGDTTGGTPTGDTTGGTLLSADIPGLRQTPEQQEYLQYLRSLPITPAGTARPTPPPTTPVEPTQAAPARVSSPQTARERAAAPAPTREPTTIIRGTRTTRQLPAPVREGVEYDPSLGPTPEGYAAARADALFRNRPTYRSDVSKTFGYEPIYSVARGPKGQQVPYVTGYKRVLTGVDYTNPQAEIDRQAYQAAYGQQYPTDVGLTAGREDLASLERRNAANVGARYEDIAAGERNTQRLADAEYAKALARPPGGGYFGDLEQGVPGEIGRAQTAEPVSQPVEEATSQQEYLQYLRSLAATNRPAAFDYADNFLSNATSEDDLKARRRIVQDAGLLIRPEQRY
jgi:hypothetical protein